MHFASEVCALAGGYAGEEVDSEVGACVMLVHVLQRLLEHGIKDEWFHILSSPLLSPRDLAYLATTSITHPKPSAALMFQVCLLSSYHPQSQPRDSAHFGRVP